MNHTPTPWKVRTLPERYGGWCFIEAPEVVAGQSVAGDYHREVMGDDYPEREGDAEFIVRACNSHDALVEALEILERPDRQLEGTPGGFYIFRLKAADITKVSEALKLARGADHA